MSVRAGVIEGAISFRNLGVIWSGPLAFYIYLHLWFTHCPSLLTVIARGLRLKKRKREESIGKLEAKKRHDRKVRRI